MDDIDPRDCIDAAPSKWCTCCKEMVDTVMVDEGIGETEYWGSRSVHHDWVMECGQCGNTDLLAYEPEIEESQPDTEESPPTSLT